MGTLAVDAPMVGSTDRKKGGRLWGPLNFLHPQKLRSLYIQNVYEHYCKNWCGTRQGFLRNAKKFRKGDTEVDMTGKVCLVTGANQGIGYATAKALASRGANVYVLCRNKDRGEKAVSNIKLETHNQNVFLEVCDLSSLQQIQNFTSRFTASNQPLHILVNNAGILEPTRRQSVDGLELNFATNVAGMFTITELLRPALIKSAPDSRVITVSSSRLYMAPVTNHLQFEDKMEFSPIEQYGRNKRLQAVITEYWAKTYGPQGIGFYIMHPGWTETEAVRKNNPNVYETTKDLMRTPEQGADTVIWLAAQPMSKLKQGGFFIDRSLRTKHMPGFGTSYTDDESNQAMSAVRALCSFPNL